MDARQATPYTGLFEKGVTPVLRVSLFGLGPTPTEAAQRQREKERKVLDVVHDSDEDEPSVVNSE